MQSVQVARVGREKRTDQPLQRSLGRQRSEDVECRGNGVVGGRGSDRRGDAPREHSAYAAGGISSYSLARLECSLSWSR